MIPSSFNKSARLKMIYLDHASTTPVDPEVLISMEPYFSDLFYNPSSLYRGAIDVKNAVDGSRKKIASFLNCQTQEIIFTSGGTESDNLAILGVCRRFKKGHIITSQIEHPAVLNCVKKMEQEGFSATYLAPDREGIISAQKVSEALRPDTVLVSIMYANNEIGSIQPIAEIARAIKKFRKSGNIPFFHSDACQATQYLNMDIKKLGVDLLTINGSKIYGPKGVGVLYAGFALKLDPIMLGGGQENGLRSGTENTAGIIGLGRAVELIDKKFIKRETALRDYMIDELLKIEGTELNGSRLRRLPNNINISFDGVEGESAVLYLDRVGIACSTGSACSSKSLEPSHVILALGKTEEKAHCSLRFTLGRKNTRMEIRKAVMEIKETIDKLRRISAIYE